MTVTISFPAEIEDALKSRAAAAGQDLEGFVKQLVTETLGESVEPVARTRTAAEFAKRLDAWTALHPVLDHAIDDSRESFYSGRE